MKVIAIILFSVLTVGCTNAPIKVPYYQWPNSAAGELARASLHNSYSYLRSERQYKKAVRENSAKSKFIDTFSVGVGWSFSQDELVPAVRVNLLRIFEDEKEEIYLSKDIVGAKKQHLFKLKKLITELIITKQRENHNLEKLDYYRSQGKASEINLAQYRMIHNESKLRFSIKLDEIITYTGLNEDVIKNTLNHYEIYI